MVYTVFDCIKKKRKKRGITNEKSYPLSINDSDLTQSARTASSGITSRATLPVYGIKCFYYINNYGNYLRTAKSKISNTYIRC